MRKQHVVLNEADRPLITAIISKGCGDARVYRRALALQELDRGQTLTTVAALVGVGYETVASWRDKYKQMGLKCLEDAPRAGRPIAISGAERAHITALACSTPPQGHLRWDLRLLAGKSVELGYCEHISHTHVATILKKTNSSPT